MSWISSMDWSGSNDSLNGLSSSASIRSMGWIDWNGWIASTNPISWQVHKVSQLVPWLQHRQLVPLVEVMQWGQCFEPSLMNSFTLNYFNEFN